MFLSEWIVFFLRAVFSISIFLLSRPFVIFWSFLGKIVKKTDYYAEYDSHKYYIYEYNSDNRLIKRYYYIDNDILERIREYDPETGMQINETFYNTDEN